MKWILKSLFKCCLHLLWNLQNWLPYFTPSFFIYVLLIGNKSHKGFKALKPCCSGKWSSAKSPFLLEGAFPAENILERLEPEQFQFLGAMVGISQPLEFLWKSWTWVSSVKSRNLWVRELFLPAGFWESELMVSQGIPIPEHPVGKFKDWEFLGQRGLCSHIGTAEITGNAGGEGEVWNSSIFVNIPESFSSFLAEPTSPCSIPSPGKDLLPKSCPGAWQGQRISPLHFTPIQPNRIWSHSHSPPSLTFPRFTPMNSICCLVESFSWIFRLGRRCF